MLFLDCGRHEVRREKFTHMDAGHPKRKYMKVHVCESVCVFLGAIRDRESDEGQQ